MSALYLALPIALLLAIAAVIAFIWAVRSGQMDDLDTPAARMLVDDDASETPKRRTSAATSDRCDDDTPSGVG